MIPALLSPSRHVRRHALDRLPVDRETAYAARELLVTDEDASVRARAAFFLAKAPVEIALAPLQDALDDPMPLVRHAAVRALAFSSDVDSFERVARVAIEDPIWWVRRAAVISAASLGGASSVATLREALEDPFWRVRAAAVRAWLSLGEGDLGPATSARSAGALSYIQRRLGGLANESNGELDVPNALVARLDPDPAVVTARVERGDAVTPAFLVECLGDPHQTLRVTARKRLARTRDMRAFELALLWLDEPRIPHAAKTVIELLDRLDADDAHQLLDIAFERGAAGALCWAASYVGLTRDASRVDALIGHVRAAEAIVRCAVITALGEIGGDLAVEAIVAALGDSDARVVRTAVETLFTHGDARADAALAALSLDATVAIRRVLVAAAAERKDMDALRTLSRDTDAHVRAAAVTARASMNDLDSAERAACMAGEDPWIRIAALDASSAALALANDPQPWVRRAAFRSFVSADARRAGQLASASADPWLQTRAAALLDPRDPEHLVSLLRLARDASAAVRAAAADALQRSDIDDALDALLASDRIRGEEYASVRIAALAHRSRHFDPADFARLEAASLIEIGAVRAWIDDVRNVTPEAEVTQPKRAVAAAPLRTLGASGIGSSALVISGAGIMPTRAYVDAMHAGCNLFFWEPRYHTLGRMLAGHRDVGVVCGSYEATERAIVSDVDRSLRRLRRDTLDVFLLFWARSPARVAAPLHDVLARLKQAGKIRAFGFSTHDRELACDALEARAWDVVMTRHSAVHPGAEGRLFPLAREKNVGVLAFSVLSYGRALGETISAPEAYGYSLAQPGVSACLSAPRTSEEIEQNLTVLCAPPLSPQRQVDLRAHGKTVHEESRDFARSIRRHPIGLADTRARDLVKWLDQEDVLDPRFE